MPDWTLCLASPLYFPRTYKHTSFHRRIGTGKTGAQSANFFIGLDHRSLVPLSPPPLSFPTTPSIDFDRTFDLLQIEVDFNRVFAKVSIARFGQLLVWLRGDPCDSSSARSARGWRCDAVTLTGWLMRSAAVERVWNLWQNIWAALYQVGAIAARCEY